MREFPEIRSRENLEFAYAVIHTLADSLPREYVDDVKRSVRRYLNKNAYQDRRIISSDSDGMMVLVQLPESIQTREGAEEYFEANEVMEAIPSQYDCTGQLFTSWYHLFQRNGRWCAYHRICADV